MASKSARFRRKAIIYALAALTFLASIPFFPEQGIVKSLNRTALACAFFLVPPSQSSNQNPAPSVHCECRYIDGTQAPMSQHHVQRSDGVTELYLSHNSIGRSVSFGMMTEVHPDWRIERYSPILINTPNGVESDEVLGLRRRDVFAAFVEAVLEPNANPYPAWFFPPSVWNDGVKDVRLQSIRMDNYLGIASAIVAIIFMRASFINLIRYRRSLRPVGKRLCPMCAYELEGLPLDTRCPECGH